MAYPGFYFDGESTIPCRIIRMGARNSTIELDGVRTLVPTEQVERTECVANEERNLTELILPITPLEMLYRELRELRGSKDARFEATQSRLTRRHGATDAIFLAELFRRSVEHAKSYRNVAEDFCPDRPDREVSEDRQESRYARQLVQFMYATEKIKINSLTMKFVDYEVFPFRTTRSCTERGVPATTAGSGGMDMLLSVTPKTDIPTVGEIKANTEDVGPTFALIQSLMYAAHIATPNQFERLARCYPTLFGNFEKDRPSVGVAIILESEQECLPKDLAYAQTIATFLVKSAAAPQISAIRFIESTNVNGFRWRMVHEALRE